jgi:hypothetical protein
MKTIQFDGPTAVLVVDGQRIKRGESAEVSSEAAGRIKKIPGIRVEVLADEPAQTKEETDEAPASDADNTEVTRWNRMRS